MKKDLKTLVIENLNGETADEQPIKEKTCQRNLPRLRDGVLKKIADLKPKRPDVAHLITKWDEVKEFDEVLGEWYELLNRIEIKLGKHTKCPYCGSKMRAMSFPKYSMSDWINDQCDGISEGRPRVRCLGHRSGPLRGEVKWYSPEEWEDHVNIIDGVDTRVEMRKRAEA